MSGPQPATPLQLVQPAAERAAPSTADRLVETVPPISLDPRQALQDMRLESSLSALLTKSFEPFGMALSDATLNDRFGDVQRQYTLASGNGREVCLLQVPQWIVGNPNRTISVQEISSAFEGRVVRILSQKEDSGTAGLKRLLGDWGRHYRIDARLTPWKHVKELQEGKATLADVLELELTAAPLAPAAARRTPFVFVSYSHLDSEWLQEIQKQLKIHLRDEQFRAWDDSHIQPGALWNAEIQQALDAATVAVLLVSTNFLASSFVYGNELPVLLDASAGGRLKLLWVLVSPCAFEKARLDRFQAVHDIQTSLQALKEQSRAGLDKTLTDIGKAIAEAAAG